MIYHLSFSCGQLSRPSGKNRVSADTLVTANWQDGVIIGFIDLHGERLQPCVCVCVCVCGGENEKETTLLTQQQLQPQRKAKSNYLLLPVDHNNDMQHGSKDLRGVLCGQIIDKWISSWKRI